MTRCRFCKRHFDCLGRHINHCEVAKRAQLSLAERAQIRRDQDDLRDRKRRFVDQTQLAHDRVERDKAESVREISQIFECKICHRAN